MLVERRSISYSPVTSNLLIITLHKCIGFGFGLAWFKFCVKFIGITGVILESREETREA